MTLGNTLVVYEQHRRGWPGARLQIRNASKETTNMSGGAPNRMLPETVRGTGHGAHEMTSILIGTF